MDSRTDVDAVPVYAVVIRRCDGCRFWERIDTEDDLVLEGYCKRFPPVIVSDVLANVRELPLYRGPFAGMTSSGMLQSASVWPVTLEHESCGEWAEGYRYSSTGREGKRE